MNHNTTTRSATKSPLTVVRAALAGLALLAVTVVGAGCAPVTNDEPRTANPVSSSTPQPSTDASSPSPSPQAEEPTSEDIDAEIDELLADIDSATEVTDGYWRTHWSEFFTGSYTAPNVVGLYDSEDPENPVCDGGPLLDNNAHYCSDGHFVAWDDDLMLRALDLGDSWVYFVIAHEWGHAIVDQLDPSLQWNAYELQADCLAGAALYGAAEDGTISLSADFTDRMVDNLSEVADQTPWTDRTDHGDALDRIEAFNEGRTGGVEACMPQE